MKRVFAAIKIDASTHFLSVFNQLKVELKRDKIKWVEPYNVHITLKFFGETEESKIGRIIALFNEIAQNHKAFDLSIKNVGIFGSSYKPRVIWFGIENIDSLMNLANDILDQLQNIGFDKDRQNFVPHLTVGRIKYIDSNGKFQEVVNKYKSVEIQEQKVNQFYLIESILKEQGPEYKILESFQLQ